jgi:NAD(P)-dependent dehydrogenase (short-subunit alcohol dehydrogenase family)
MKIEGTAALVTGGASGLGEATVRMLVSHGARVLIVDRDAERAAALAAELGPAVAYSTADVTDGEQAAAAVAQASEPGPLRIAVNCAGIGVAAKVVGRDGSPHDLEMFKRVIGVNLIGTFNMLRLAAAAIAKTPALEHGERGVIVNTASIAAYDGQIGQIAYSASKGGVVGMTLPAARDLSSLGIRVMTIAPGIMDTPMLAKLPEPARVALGESVVFPKRLGMPGEYAALVHHIVSNGYLNGEVIRLDGSLRMAPK